MADYDVIVVGAGAAGAPLAARLSEDEGRKVLLLEAGKDYTRTEDFPPAVKNGGTFETMIPGAAHDWGFQGQLTPEKTLVVNRGKILGGSTALNGTYFVRGRKTDFDAWSQNGNDLWKWENVLPFYKKLEADQQYGDSDVHNSSGPVFVTRPSLDNDFGKAFMAGAKELGHPEELDKNDQQEPGAGPIPTNNKDGLRVNTGIAYINPIRDSRKNLTVQGETFVRRVVFEGKRAVGVEVEHKGEIKIIKGGQIVLSAGAMKTPHILMLSGIGPKEQLEKHGIPVLLDRPGVGQEFSDHPDLMVTWAPKHDIGIYDNGHSMLGTLNYTSTNDEGYVNDIEIMFNSVPFGYLMSGSRAKFFGPFAAAMRNPIGSLKAMFGSDFGSYISQLMSAHHNYVGILLQKQASRGNMTLVSGDPKDYPKFVYNYFTAEIDRIRLREGIRKTVDLLHTNAFSSIFDRLANLNQKMLADDAALDKWMQTNLLTGIHMAGTARFGADNDPLVVVDQYGRVLGVEGLRIADGSILPDTTSRGPANSTVMIGELMADVIRKEDGQKVDKAQ